MPNVSEAARELEYLYPEDVIERLVCAGHARLVYGLRGGCTRSWVDEKLQLGADLACCPGWRDRARLVGNLRSPRGYTLARPEVGIWAGLRRVELEPRVEEADTATAKRADWLVPCCGLDVALELKTLSDPAYEQDRTELMFALAARIEEVRHGGPPVAIAFRPSALVETLMGSHHVHFCLQRLEAVREEIRLAAPQIEPGASVELPTCGQLVVHATADVANSYRVETSPTDLEHLVSRAAHKVRAAAAQLAATRADLRAAVVLGSREWLPSFLAPHIAQRSLDLFPDDGVDWVVVVNEGMLGDGAWITDAVQARRREAPPVPDQVLQGLVEWGSRSSLNS